MSPSPRKAPCPPETSRGGAIVRTLVLLAVLSLALSSLLAQDASGATQAQVSQADSTIQAAFLSTHDAEARGGNVSSLVTQLNTAIGLVQRAEAENATDPAQASSDLANATLVANGVVTAAGPVGQQGATARQGRLYVSAGSAAAIVVLAALIYAFGDRIYRAAWLRLYGGHVVRKLG